MARIPAFTRSFNEKEALTALFFFLVAGAGIAPTARGYEPREILLLHPAARHYTTRVMCLKTMP